MKPERTCETCGEQAYEWPRCKSCGSVDLDWLHHSILTTDLTPSQARMVLASGPDDITGEEGCGIPISGSDYRVARALEQAGLGTYSHGSPYGDLYFNNREGLKVRAYYLHHSILDHTAESLSDPFKRRAAA